MEHPNFVVLMMVTGLSFVIYLILYRLYYHPLVQFPGPLLARATYAYEWYYDLVLGGQYTFKLRELHEKYGPVIRLNPDELHFNDPDYYDEIFNVTNGEAEKPYRVANVFGPYPAAIGTQGHHLHRIRRGALNPFFSKRSVLDLVPFIRTHIDRLCARFDAASKSSEPIDLKYCFAANLHVPWVMKLMYKIPLTSVKDRIMRILNPAMSDILDMREDLAQQVEDIRSQKDLSYTKSGHRTVFHDLLESSLPLEEMTRNRLRDEAFSLITAGSGTTAYVLRNLSYHIAADHRVQQKLLSELRTVMQHPTSRPDLQKLESLPYLNAVIQEGLRMTQPITHRLSRLFPKKTLVFQGKIIPPGTVVHMTALLIHENEDIFPDAKSFIPERWLDSKLPLKRYLVPFARGPRSCLGINLAWAELYLIVAMVFRRFDFDIAGVVRERDIDAARDVIMGVPRSDSKGVVVKVSENEN
ncbi:benzoate 4-monooxygenase cytochrome P450 protein [Rutstroemia sp. NJR-2017a BBW]|nr:benzoate 4-monooxygenase cytochrome P450 protein [Rutstroemia sp. NJR-2017a BBW]